MSLRKYTVRAMQMRLGRTILTVLSIVIGVSAVVAVGLLTSTTRGAYNQMFATVTGKATLEIDAPGGAGFKEDLLAKVRKVKGVQSAVPLVQKPASMFVGDKQVRVQVMGIDPKVDSAVRDYEVVKGRPLGEGNQVVLDEEFARFMDLDVGDKVGFLTKRRRREFEIVGLVKPRGGEALRQASLVFMHVDRAQYYYYPTNRKQDLYDKIQIITDSGDERIEAASQAIAKILPESPKLEVHRPSGSTQLMRETLFSSEQGLKITSYFTLLLALFIILNTLFMNVGERRRQLAIMRAIGATRGQIARAMIIESVFLGILGTTIGYGVGYGAAWISTRTLVDVLDVKLPPVSEVMTIWPFLWGALYGIGLAVVGALLPAMRAGRVSPLEGMSRVVPRDSQSWSWPLFLGGLVLSAIGGTLIYGGMAGWLPTDYPVYGAIPLLIGIVALETVMLWPQASFLAWLLRPLAKVESKLALKQILRHNTRSALTVGVLFCAGAAGIGIANSILDNLHDVHDWKQQAIVGDFYVRAMMPDMASGTAADLPEGVGQDLQKIPDIESLDTVSLVEINVRRPDGTEEENATAIAVARAYTLSGPPPFDLIEGNADDIRRQLEEGQVVLGSVLASKLKLHSGQKLHVETLAGPRDLPIAAVANEYMVGGMAVHMHRDVAVKHFGVEGVDAYLIRAEPGKLAVLQPKLEALVKNYSLLLQSNAEISANIDRMVRGIEGGLWVLVFLGFVVAAFGVVNTLTMNVLEQTRELGLLRIVAMTKKQVRRTILTQALIIGGVGLPPGILTGVGMAYIMNYAMGPSFGHDIAFHLNWVLLVGTCVVAFLIVLMAAIIPARRAAQIDVVEALHYE